MHATLIDQPPVGATAVYSSVPRTVVDPAEILESLPAAVVVVDEKGIVAMANATADAWLGPDLVGRRWQEAIDESCAIAPSQTVRLRTGRVVEVTTRPQSDGRGQIVLFVDVTSGRMAEALARRRERLAHLGQMVSGIAHQLRTPLATVRLQLAALAREGDERTLRRLESLRQGHERIERMVEDLLVFARGGDLPMERIDVDAFVDAFLTSTAPRCGRAGVRLTIERRCAGAVIEANAPALAGILDNLVDNALQALAGHRREEAGRIHVELERVVPGRDVESLVIRISDNGPGIDPGVRERLFEPFQTGRPQGTGLGLAVARLVAEAHGGSLDVDEVHDGASFVLRLPLVAAGRHGG